MRQPTPEELKTEIESGPFAEELAVYWANVFPQHHKPELAWRTGKLTPDAAYDICRILTDTSRRTKTLAFLTRGAFLAAVAPMALALASPSMPEEKKERWTILLNILTGGNDEVDITRPNVQALLNIALADGLFTEQQRAALVNGGTTTQSRAEELGWSLVPELVSQAKEVV